MHLGVMNPNELIASGNLVEAIAAQSAEVKAHPVDLDARYQLSVLLCFAGDLDRASIQLNTIGAQDQELGMASAIYRSLIVADSARRTVWNEEGDPLLPPDCAPGIEDRVAALQAMRRGDNEAASQALERSLASEKPLEVKLNGELTRDLRDYDDFLGPVLEVYAGGNYLWLPFERIRTLEVAAPKTELDLLWAPAQLVDANGMEANVHLPVLYEGSHRAEDGRVRVGRMTEWVDVEGLGFRGQGQRTLLAEQGGDSREIGLLEVRSLERAPSSEADGG